jgi:hypothetical protein
VARHPQELALHSEQFLIVVDEEKFGHDPDAVLRLNPRRDRGVNAAGYASAVPKAADLNRGFR